MDMDNDFDIDLDIYMDMDMDKEMDLEMDTDTEFNASVQCISPRYIFLDSNDQFSNDLFRFNLDFAKFDVLIKSKFRQISQKLN
jgi:hypothetical protein